MIEIEFRRTTLFAGHYGSGKTNLAVNYALKLRESFESVVIADLDIVNPYFRTKDSEELLRSRGIEIISSEYANSNVDFPALPSEMYGVVQNRSRHAVLDIGGDDRGAYALGRFAPYIIEENDYDMLFVANFCRPLTLTPEDALEVMREIESAGGIKFNGIVNNTNLAALTTPKTVYDGQEKSLKLSKMSGLPLKFTAVERELSKAVKLNNVFELDVQKRYYDLY